MTKRKRRSRPLSNTPYARRLRNTRAQKKRVAAAKKALPKIRLYHGLVKSFIDKQKQKDEPVTYQQAQKSPVMKKIIADLKKGERLRKRGRKNEGNRIIKQALEKTTRRDGVPERFAPGESPQIEGRQAA